MIGIKSKMVAIKLIKTYINPTVLHFLVISFNFLQVDWQTHGKLLDQYLKPKYHLKKNKDGHRKWAKNYFLIFSINLLNCF